MRLCASMTGGILNLYKPSGISSGDAVARVKKALCRRDVGHLGTLDPLAAGVLPIAVGKATRLFDFFLQKTKTYRAVFRFGVRSDTLDITGVCERLDTPKPSRDGILAAAKAVTGTYPQIPPAYSAKSIGGVRAYKLAREGIEVVLPPKTVNVFCVDVLGETPGGDFEFEITCGSGTYIRSIGRDMAAHLGTAAVMTALVRTRSGQWLLEDSVSLDNLEKEGERAVIPTEQVLCGLLRLDVPISQKKRLDNGVPIALQDLSDDCRTVTGEDRLIRLAAEGCTVYCEGVLYGLGRLKDGCLSLSVYLKE